MTKYIICCIFGNTVLYLNEFDKYSGDPILVEKESEAHHYSEIYGASYALKNMKEDKALVMKVEVKE